MKKFIVYCLWFMVILTIYHIPYTIYAAESSPSADIKSKLEELKREIASKAAKLKMEVNRKLKDKAYAGIIKSKSDTALTLATDSGPKIVNLNQDTVFESKIKSAKQTLPKNILLEDYVAALGDSDETGVLTAKKVILLPTANSQKPKAYLWGQIISISDPLLTLRNRELKNIAATLPDIPAAKLNDFVILTGSMNKNNIFDAGFVYVITQGGIIKPKKIVYPERSQGATPSASDKNL